MKGSPVALALGLMALAVASLNAAEQLRFAFGQEVAQGFRAVSVDSHFDPVRSFGFEPGTQLESVFPAGNRAISVGVTADRPFLFTTRLPYEGNWRVTVVFGHPTAASTTTIKAELRRLMVESVKTQPGESVRVTFVVNTRTPRIAATNGIAGGEVRLKAPRETVQEACAWDDALTLEFLGEKPTLRTIEIEPADEATVAALVDKAFGDRFGLVAFSGAAELMCPLTLDHGYFDTVLNAVDTDSISLEGTNIAASFKVAVDAFKQQDLEDKGVIQKMAEVGADAKGCTPEEARQLMIDTIAKWKKVIEDAKIPLQG